jgi:hypothetical protein
MTTPMFSINGASEILERDRRTICKALRHTPPDGKERGAPRYRLKTIIDALAAHKHPVLDGGNDLPAYADEIESAFSKLDGQFARLQAEPNLERRRALTVEMDVGRTINDLDQLMLAANKADKEMGPILQLASDKLVGGTVSRLIELCDCWDDIERSALK